MEIIEQAESSALVEYSDLVEWQYQTMSLFVFTTLARVRTSPAEQPPPRLPKSADLRMVHLELGRSTEKPRAINRCTCENIQLVAC